MVLGTVLLVTAGLKIHGLVSDPYAQDSILLTPRLLVAVIEVELLLGLWLLSGWATRAAWVAALAFFGLLSAATFYLALEGQRSCGCFGRVEVNPWITFALDVAAMLALLIWRPARRQSTTAIGSMPYALKTALSASVLVAVAGGAFLLLTDDPARALAQLRGETLSVDPPVTDVGEGPAGEQRTFTVQLVNHTDHTVRVVGGTTTCQCIATNDLPISIVPNHSEPMTVQIRFRGSPGRFQHRFVLYTDSEDKRRLTARFAGRVSQD
jgi:hypothetical protein